MLFRNDILGKEVIDSDGNTLGVVEDVDINEKWQVTKLVIVPKGIIRVLSRKRNEVKAKDVESISKVIVLKKTKDEPIKKKVRKKKARRSGRR